MLKPSPTATIMKKRATAATKLMIASTRMLALQSLLHDAEGGRNDKPSHLTVALCVNPVLTG
jgi:hypothetical protein